MWPISVQSRGYRWIACPFAVNTHIPEDIVVKAAYEVADDFNAIGSCIQKEEYTYRIYNSGSKPLLRSPGVFLSQAG